MRGWFYIPGGCLWMIALEMLLPRAIYVYVSLVSLGALVVLVSGVNIPSSEIERLRCEVQQLRDLKQCPRERSYSRMEELD